MTNSTTSSDKKGMSSFWRTATLIGVIANFKSLSALSIGLFKFGWLLPTLGTMLLSVALYAIVYGWNIAVIIVLLLLIHELGHWIWMKAYRLDPKAPMFVPFLGAFVAMTKMPANEATHAWVAFAGPLVGGITSLILFLVAREQGNLMLRAAGAIGILLNIFQLIPAKPFDGGFIVGAISKWLLVPGMIGLFILAANLHSPFLVIIGLLGIKSFFTKKNKNDKYRGLTLREFEQKFVQDHNNEEKDNQKATVAQRVQIGIAYLTLTCVLGLALTWANIESGHSDKAFAAAQTNFLTKAIEKHDDSNLRYLRGQLYADEGQPQDAATDLKRSIDLGKKDYGTYFNYGRALLMTGETGEQTVSTFLSAAALAPADSSDKWACGYGILLCGDSVNALKVASDLAEFSDIKAEIFERSGETDKARKYYDEKVASNPNLYWGTRNRRALFFLSENQLDLAKADIDKAISIDADEASLYLTSGWYYFKRDKLTEAWEESSKALEESKTDTWLDKLCVIDGIHKLRFEIAKKQTEKSNSSAEKIKWTSTAKEELKEYEQNKKLGTLYIPRNLE